ncbi:hypothetical protein [Sphingobacterium kitahiroshimense]|uniref:Uncharacterized protein n=1 Tax=Sphingobacterium kitahiroshimense TaxID=470446 RepID=A0ABV0BY47_9SPHI
MNPSDLIQVSAAMIDQRLKQIIRHVVAKDTREVIQIHELNAEIDATVNKIHTLRSTIANMIKEIKA